MEQIDFQNIKTLEDLSGAIVLNKARLERQGLEVRQRLNALQGFYTPQTLLTEGVRRATHSFSFYGVALTLIGALRRRLKRR